MYIYQFFRKKKQNLLRRRTLSLKKKAPSSKQPFTGDSSLSVLERKANYVLYMCVQTRVEIAEIKRFNLGADFKNNLTTQQLNNFIWTNRKQVNFCFYLPIGLNKLV